MAVTIILFVLVSFTIFYIIINNQISKIKKEYIKSDLIDEMKDLISVFTEEINNNIIIMEELISEADKRIKLLNNNENMTSDIKNITDTEINEKSYNIDNKSEIEEKDIDYTFDWQEMAVNLFENGYSIDKISEKLSKSVQEIRFVIEFSRMKNELKRK